MCKLQVNNYVKQRLRQASGWRASVNRLNVLAVTAQVDWHRAPEDCNRSGVSCRHKAFQNGGGGDSKHRNGHPCEVRMIAAAGQEHTMLHSRSEYVGHDWEEKNYNLRWEAMDTHLRYLLLGLLRSTEYKQTGGGSLVHSRSSRSALFGSRRESLNNPLAAEYYFTKDLHH